jgi:hypothetical protein
MITASSAASEGAILMAEIASKPMAAAYVERRLGERRVMGASSYFLFSCRLSGRRFRRHIQRGSGRSQSAPVLAKIRDKTRPVTQESTRVREKGQFPAGGAEKGQGAAGFGYHTTTESRFAARVTPV